jgi:magnesium-transporting ATPase (P-type)
MVKFVMNTMDGKACLEKRKELTEDRILCIVPFTSTRKRGSIVVRYPLLKGTNQEVRVYCKGAPDVLFTHLTQVVAKDGEVKNKDSLDEVPDELLNGEVDGAIDSELGLLKRAVKKFADQAYRTILVAYRDMSIKDFETLKEKHNGF